MRCVELGSRPAPRIGFRGADSDGRRLCEFLNLRIAELLKCRARTTRRNLYGHPSQWFVLNERLRFSSSIQALHGSKKKLVNVGTASASVARGTATPCSPVYDRADETALPGTGRFASCGQPSVNGATAETSRR